MNMEQSVSKLPHIKFRRRGITQKKAYNKVNIPKIWVPLPNWPWKSPIPLTSAYCGKTANMIHYQFILTQNSVFSPKNPYRL